MKNIEEGLKETMCVLAARKALKEMKEAAKDAEHICTSCGRSAAQKEALCVPEPLKDSKEHEEHKEE
ncbi:MAG: hypothetical protein AUJ51_11305 [Elusimicrobia bacterium CG1_02_56_21]|nr:MAG: hypothetical protein AUJ51_11305 [Elusimicrobia bacterium CG1_02_56_21]